MYRIRSGLIILSTLLASFWIVAQDDLSETFTSTDRTISFQYPAGWEALEQGGQIVVTNNVDALTSDDPFPAGTVGMIIATPQTYEELLGFLEDSDVTIDSDLEALALASIATFDGDPADFETVEITTGPNATIAITTGNVDQLGDMLLAVLDFEGTRLLALGFVASDELDDTRPTLQGIIDTINYAPAEDIPVTDLVPITADNISAVTIVQSFEVDTELTDEEPFLRSLDLNSDGSRVATLTVTRSGSNETFYIQVYRVPSGDLITAFELPVVEVDDPEEAFEPFALTFLPDDRGIFLADREFYFVFDATTGETLESGTLDSAIRFTPVYSPDGSLAMLRLENPNEAVIIDTTTRETLFTLDATNPGWSSFTPDNRYFVYRTFDFDTESGELVVLDLTTNTRLYTMPLTESISSPMISADASRLAWTVDDTLTVIDLPNGDVTLQTKIETDFLDEAVFDPTGTLMYLVDTDVLYVYNLDGELVNQLSVGSRVFVSDLQFIANAIIAEADDRVVIFGVPTP